MTPHLAAGNLGPLRRADLHSPPLLGPKRRRRKCWLTDTVTLPIQNQTGKRRAEIQVPADMSKEEVEKVSRSTTKAVIRNLGMGARPKKVIVVPGDGSSMSLLTSVFFCLCHCWPRRPAGFPNPFMAPVGSGNRVAKCGAGSTRRMTRFSIPWSARSRTRWAAPPAPLLRWL